MRTSRPSDAKTRWGLVIGMALPIAIVLSLQISCQVSECAVPETCPSRCSTFLGIATESGSFPVLAILAAVTVGLAVGVLASFLVDRFRRQRPAA